MDYDALQRIDIQESFSQAFYIADQETPYGVISISGIIDMEPTVLHPFACRFV